MNTYIYTIRLYTKARLPKYLYIALNVNNTSNKHQLNIFMVTGVSYVLSPVNLKKLLNCLYNNQ